MTTTTATVITAKASGKALARKIALVRASGDKLNKLIHETGMAALKHAHAHGDAQYCQQLVMACPASMRRSMLIAWFGKYSPVVVKDSQDWTAKIHKQDSKLFVPWNIEAADNEPFYVLAEKNPEKVYDFKALVAMVERLGKAIEKKVADGKVPDEDIPSAENIATVIQGLSFKRIAVSSPANEEKNSDDKGQEETAGEAGAKETLGVELKQVA